MDKAEIEQLRQKWELELKGLMNVRNAVSAQILGLQTMIKGLDYMEHRETVSTFKLDPLPLPPGMENLLSLGLTDAIRAIINDAIDPLTPKQVRDRLIAYDYKKLPTENPMAAVHGVLRRLALTGKIIQTKIDKKTAYRASGPLDQSIVGGFRWKKLSDLK